MRHGQSLTIEGLEAGTVCTVTEEETADYRTTVQLNEEAPRQTNTIRVELPLGGTAVLFTNESTLPTPTPAPTPTPTPTLAPTPAPTLTPTSAPAPTGTPEPTPAVTAVPTVSPAPTPEKTAVPADTAEETPSPAPTREPGNRLPQTGDNAWKTCWFTALCAAALAAILVHRARFARRKR